MDVTPEQTRRLLRLLDNLDYAQRLEQLSNAQLADLLIEQVWAEIPLASPQNALVAVIIERLKEPPCPTI